MLSIVISITGPSARGSCSFSPNSLISVAARLQTDVRQLFINGYPVVIEAGGLQDDARRPHHHRHREDPEKQSVKDHGHVLPVLENLERAIMRSSELHFSLRVRIHCCTLLCGPFFGIFVTKELLRRSNCQRALFYLILYPQVYYDHTGPALWG